MNTLQLLIEYCRNFKKQYNVADSNKNVWSNTIVLRFFPNDRFQWIGGLKILSSFEIYLIIWPPYFVRRFLRTTMKSSWTLSQISKGKVFSFLHLCSYVYISCKVNVIEGWLFFGFDNAFTFALYSRMFPPFPIYTPSVAFFNGGYNFSLRRLLSKSITLPHPFFRCSLILIF